MTHNSHLTAQHLPASSQAHAGDQGFNADTHMNTSYKKLANDTKDKFDNDVNPDIAYTGEPQKVDLPFPCEEDSLAFEGLVPSK
jgi:hypothetical protein